MKSERWVSPVGELMIVTRGPALCLCSWVGGAKHARVLRQLLLHTKSEITEEENETALLVIEALKSYFRGKVRVFDLPLELHGTEFQRAVWCELQRIPYGETISYGELAARIGRPSSVRAVANAVAVNPVSIIVPCHRVVGADGSLTGFAGGLTAKSMLLDLERQNHR